MVLEKTGCCNLSELLLIFAGTTPAQPKDFDPTGWELALVTTPSSDLSAAQERQLVSPLNFNS